MPNVHVLSNRSSATQRPVRPGAAATGDRPWVRILLRAAIGATARLRRVL